jgi:hypothetical protein
VRCTIKTPGVVGKIAAENGGVVASTAINGVIPGAAFQKIVCCIANKLIIVTLQRHLIS